MWLSGLNKANHAHYPLSSLVLPVVYFLLEIHSCLSLWKRDSVGILLSQDVLVLIINYFQETNQFGCHSLSLCQANKMCSFLDLLDFSKMQQEKKTCMWKGKLSPQTFALVHLFKESNLEPCTEAMFPMTLRSSMVTFISNQVLHQLAS